MERTYTVVLLHEEDGGYSVLVPALPGCVTQGSTLAQSLDRAREAISGYIECLQARDEPVPEDSPLVTFELLHAQEATVCRVSVEEAGALA